MVDCHNNNKEEKEEVVIIDDQTVEFFDKIITALVATIAIKKEGSDRLQLPPETTRPFDALFAVLTQEQRREEAREVLNEENKEQFAKVRNQFVKDLKQAIQEGKIEK